MITTQSTTNIYGHYTTLKTLNLIVKGWEIATMNSQKALEISEGSGTSDVANHKASFTTINKSRNASLESILFSFENQL